MLELMGFLDISPTIIIDCNNYVMSGIFLHRNLRFPTVKKTKSLVCKIVGNNFDLSEHANKMQKTIIENIFITLHSVLLSSSLLNVQDIQQKF